MSISPSGLRRLLWVVLFGIAFGYVEASVVVYLRGLYYPEGFTFPLKFMMPAHLTIELLREAATMVMLITVAMLAGSRRWSRFGFFILGFGVWDIFYYVWLKVALDWPRSILDWDILFLIPLPWIGPVIAPVLISLLMIVLGWMIVVRVEGDRFFAPRAMSWTLSVIGVACVLYSFMEDTSATLHGQSPSPYNYFLLAVSLVLCMAGFLLACRPSQSPTLHSDVVGKK